jgi:hypothetical protein
MTIEKLITRFILSKFQKPTHANELLDYLRTEYIDGNIPFNHYRYLLGALYKRGAKRP